MKPQNLNPETIAPDVFQQAQRLIEDIQALAEAVLKTDNQPPLNTVRFTQLLGQRDDKLHQLGALDLKGLPTDQQQQLWDALEASKSRDLDVEAHLNQALSTIDTQLQQLHHGRQVLGRFKLNISGNENTRSDRA